VGLEALAGQDLVVVSRTVSPDYHERILMLCEQAGWMPQVVHELRHWLSVVSLVSQGLGVALVPQALQQSALAGAVFVPLRDVMHVTTRAACGAATETRRRWGTLCRRCRWVGAPLIIQTRLIKEPT
jgi:DNA-binding transcriptional LysR family regulator